MFVLRVLLTNDDGVFADGIQALRRVLERVRGTEIHVVAPDRERSASGHAITLHRPIHVDRVQLPGSTVPAYAVSGTPADCVKLALEALLPDKPDLVISGINRGANLGTDVFYSGTVSAAIEAAFSGVRSLAVSLTALEHPEYALAAEFTGWLAARLMDHQLPPRTLLNINVPACDERHLAGIALTKLGVRLYKDVFDRRTDPRGRDYYWLAGEVMEANNDPDTDVMAIKLNQISVTPIQLDLTDHQLLGRMADWKLGEWLNGR